MGRFLSFRRPQQTVLEPLNGEWVVRITCQFLLSRGNRRRVGVIPETSSSFPQCILTPIMLERPKQLLADAFQL